MKKYRCKCKYNKCEASSIEDIFIPVNCPMSSSAIPKWKEVEEEIKAEEKADEILNLPSWCKVGEMVYYTKGKLYCKIHVVDEKRGILLFNSEYLITDFVSMSELAEARLRPFNEKEMRELVGKKVVGKLTERISLVVSFSKSSISIYGHTYNNKELLELFTFTDGQPCGVYEHKENGEWVE